MSLIVGDADRSSGCDLHQHECRRSLRVELTWLDPAWREDFVADLEARASHSPDPQFDVDRLSLIRNRQQVFDLLPRNEAHMLGARTPVEHSRRRTLRRALIRFPERLDARLFQKVKHLGIVDVRIGIEVAPAEGYFDMNPGHRAVLLCRFSRSWGRRSIRISRATALSRG